MKGLDIVSDFSKLQLLSNKYAFQILKELQKMPQSGVQLAEKLGMKTPRVIYYLKKLEHSGFARQIAHKPVRGNREKFYCAVAQDFLLSAGLEETSESDSGMNSSLNNSYIEYFLKRDLDLDLNEFARVVLSDYLSIQPEERVVIGFEEQNIGIYLKIAAHLRRIGAYYRTLVSNPVLAREMLFDLPEKEVEIFYKGIAETVDWADVWIDIKRSAISDKEGVSKKRLDFFTETRRQALIGINEKAGMRAIVISIPRFEERFHTDPDALEKLTMFWKAASVSAGEFSTARDLAERIRKYETFTIHTGNDNVLHVSVDREKFIIDAGPFSSSEINNVSCIPSGEITFVPVMSTISGSIYMDYCELDYAEARGINLQVENGIVTDCRIESGDKRLEEYFRTADRQEKTISQVGFGLNPAASSVSYIPKLDTKVFGSFHLSFGDNRAVGGDITGYTGWDIITEKPKVTSNNDIILNNGVFQI
ncbi:MAG: winged helix-turn-helix domain-containing protein [Candidatus Aegiribacteria sp.]|nr:winged helix-turn-helix domain-containing protein [Candidatus Aegiribacteria sp.]